MASCFALCNANTACTSFEYRYDGAEPAAITGGTGGTCYLKDWAGFPQSSIGFAPTENFATRLTAYSTTVTSTTTVANLQLSDTVTNANSALDHHNAWDWPNHGM